MKLIKTLTILALLILPAMYANAQGEYKTNKIRDLALIYQGGAHRIDWTQEQFEPYVTHTFADGKKEWLFDGFLFLEFSNGKGRNYSYGYDKKYARKIEWEWLLNRLFERNKSLDALDKCIEQEKKEIGKPKFKHQIVLGLAIPMPKQTDWGVLDGDSLNFNNQGDQVKAVKWYINQLMDRFKKANYKNLELSGFYWVDEDTATSKNLTTKVSPYIHSKKKQFVWIPYWKARGYDKWKELGFDIAYQQPNHFFSKTIPDSRLDEACEGAKKLGMAMEFECDSRADFGLKDSYYDRMMAYINAFEQQGVYDTSAIAYYTGSKALIDLFNAPSAENKAIMDRFARHIVERRNFKALKTK